MDQKQQQQQQDQQSRARSKWPENQESANTPPPPPPPPQNCPRCDSLNTKFCYYNNYSLTQPRYFCKTCRRYWTQGGTLRNVPVGGGCRKGKRPRPTTTTTSSSGIESSRSQSPPPLAPPQLSTNLSQETLSWMRATSDSTPCISPGMMVTNRTNSQNSCISPSIMVATTTNSQNSCISAGMIVTNATTSSIYPTGGFLSSLASMQSFNQHQGINQGLDLTHGLGIGGSSSAADHAKNSIFSGFVFQLAQSLQLQQASGYQEKDEQEKNGETLHGQTAINLGSWIHRDNNMSNPSTSNINFWNGGGGGTSDGMTSSSLNANPWPNLPGFGGPP